MLPASRPRRGLLLCACALLACSAQPQPDPGLSDREQERWRALLAPDNLPRRAADVRAFARQHAAAADPLLIAQLPLEPYEHVRMRIVSALARSGTPEARVALERAAREDVAAAVALRALQELHELRTAELVAILEDRLRRAPEGPDRVQLVAAHDHWLGVARGGLLPRFLRRAPATFEVVPRGRRIRVVAFGDAGSGSEAQSAVASALRAYHSRTAIDFGLTLGDNFYPAGVQDPQDPLWTERWSRLYDPLGVPFYATLGNHDWATPDGPAAEILFDGEGSSWRMPAARYSFTAGAAQFFALDTTALSQAQLDWLSGALDASTARWRIVFGHHPIRSVGQHGDQLEMVERLLPVLADRADLYLAGHDHDMQHLAPEGALHLLVAGSGGAEVRPVSYRPGALFAHSGYGFVVLEVDREQLVVRFMSHRLDVLHEYRLGAPASLAASR